MTTPPAHRSLAVLLALTALLGLTACIQRPTSPREKRDRFDRSRLGDVVLKEVPPFSKRVGAVFGGSAELVGVELKPATARPGDTVEVTYLFRVLDEAEEDYKVFVHVDDRGGRGERINADHWPAGGRYPTSAWRKGEVVRDVWSFKVPGHYQGEAFDLWTGFYQPGKDDRWPLTNRQAVQNDGQNRVLAATLPVAR